MKASIYTAVELTPAEKREVVALVEKKVGKKVDPVYAIRPSLLGGMRIEVGDLVIDTTLSRQIETSDAETVSTKRVGKILSVSDGVAKVSGLPAEVTYK